MTPKDLAAYVFLAIAWGLSFLVLDKVVAAFGWAGAVSFRVLFAGVALLVVAMLAGRRLALGRLWPRLTVVGATTVAGQLTGLSLATPRIGTAMTAIIVATIPLLSMLMDRLSGGARLTKAGIAGLLLGIVGVVLLVGFPAVPMTAEFLLGCVFAQGGAAASALGTVYASRRLREAGSFEVSTGSFLAGGLMTLPLLIWVPVPGTPSLDDYGWLAILGGVMSGLSYLIYFWLVPRIGATRAISVEFAVTVVAVIVGALVLEEALTPVQLVGGTVILAGCALVLGLFDRRRSGAPTPPS